MEKPASSTTGQPIRKGGLTCHGYKTAEELGLSGKSLIIVRPTRPLRSPDGAPPEPPRMGEPKSD